MSAATCPVPPAKALLTPQQAAEYLQIKEQTLNNWRCVGRGPKFLRVGRLIRYRIDLLEKWLEAQK